jgi:hypothetical protein
LAKKKPPASKKKKRARKDAQKNALSFLEPMELPVKNAVVHLNFYVTINNHQKVADSMSNFQIENKGQIQNVGDGTTNGDATFHQTLSAPQLSGRIEDVLLVARRAPGDAEQVKNVQLLEDAHTEAKAGNAAGAIDLLKKSGTWLTELAKSTGSKVIADLIEKQLK